MKRLLLLVPLLLRAQVTPGGIPYTWGTTAARPVPCVVGQLYLALDTGIISYCSVQGNPGTWTNTAGGGGGGGTVTVQGGGNLTNGAFMTGAGLQVAQTPNANATLDSSGNGTFNTLAVGFSSTQGAYDLFGATSLAPSIGAGMWRIAAPNSAIGTPFEWRGPNSAATGFVLGTASGAVVTLTQVGQSGTGSVCMTAGCAINLSSGSHFPHVISFVLDGGGIALTTGSYYIGQGDATTTCTITGWVLTGEGGPGSISIALSAHANSAPPSAPATPNTTTDKISASAPMAISAANSAAGGATEVSTWTTSRTAWDTYLINVVSVSTFTRVTGSVLCQ